jgi:hypothetical protein
LLLVDVCHYFDVHWAWNSILVSRFMSLVFEKISWIRVFYFLGYQLWIWMPLCLFTNLFLFFKEYFILLISFIGYSQAVFYKPIIFNITYYTLLLLLTFHEVHISITNLLYSALFSGILRCISSYFIIWFFPESSSVASRPCDKEIIYMLAFQNDS